MGLPVILISREHFHGYITNYSLSLQDFGKSLLFLRHILYSTAYYPRVNIPAEEEGVSRIFPVQSNFVLCAF